jgi:hypothetical protein
MPRGPAPQWRARKEPVTDDYLLTVVNRAGGPGEHDANGCYGTLVIKGFTSRDEAQEWNRSLYRCALWLTRNRGADISVSTKITGRGESWSLTFTVHNKTHARLHIMTKHGPDRRGWPYDPRRRNT